MVTEIPAETRNTFPYKYHHIIWFGFRGLLLTIVGLNKRNITTQQRIATTEEHVYRDHISRPLQNVPLLPNLSVRLKF
jgi:hypothetical protein